MDQLKIQVADPGQSVPSRDRAAITAVASDVGTWLQRDHGLAIREVQVPEPHAHPHQWQADALLLSLLAGGAASLLLSTILVATMLNTLFTQQIPQIGIMKAIGARSGRIGRMYLAMTSLAAVAATLVALPLAVLLGRFAVGNFLGFLGIAPTSLAAPWWTYLVVLAAGLGLPPSMALIPLVKASRTTVRAAIDHHGLGARPSAVTGVLARLSRLRRLDRGLLLALRNTVRRPARFLLAVGLLAIAGTVFVAGMSLSAGTAAIADEQKAQRTWDVDVQLTAPTSTEQVTTLLKRVPGVNRVEALNVAQASVAGPGQIPLTRTYPDQGHGRIAVTAIPADTLVAPPDLLEGRWLNPGETGTVVLNQVTRKNTVPDIHADDTAQLVIGAVDKRLTEAGIEVKSAVSISRSEAVSAGHLGPVILILLGIALPLGVVGVIGLASTMSTNILDRTREFGVMHAIGAVPKVVRRIVVAEGVLLALASCLLAIIPTLALTAVLGAGLGNLFFSAPLPYRISLPAAGIWTALVVLGAVLATEAAATRAFRLTVREALTYL